MKKQIVLLIMTICLTSHMRPQFTYDEQEIAEAILGKNLDPDLSYMQEPLNAAYLQASYLGKQATDYMLKTFLYCLQKANDIMGYEQRIPKRYRDDYDMYYSQGCFEMTFDQAGNQVCDLSKQAQDLFEKAEKKRQEVGQAVTTLLTSQNKNDVWSYFEQGKAYVVEMGKHFQQKYAELTTNQKAAILGVTVCGGLLYVVIKKNSSHDDTLDDSE